MKDLLIFKNVLHILGQCKVNLNNLTRRFVKYDPGHYALSLIMSKIRVSFKQEKISFVSSLNSNLNSSFLVFILKVFPLKLKS